MEKRKYVLILDGERLVASIDGKENDQSIPRMVEMATVQGWTAKEVDKTEFEERVSIEEERDLNKLFE